MKNLTSSNSGQKVAIMQIIPVMLCFFTMGFVDLVGSASNSVKHDLSLTDAEANLFPSMVFFWFLIFSVPTSMLMNKIGRKKTVLISIIVTAVSLIIPIFGDSYMIMLVSFSLLGIGNAIMQTSLNPLVSNLISNDKLASTLTFGQFVKAIASFLAPVLITCCSNSVLPNFGLGWRAFFVIFAAVSFLSIALLAATPIQEEKPDSVTGFKESIKLLGRPFILLCFIGIMCHVGIDVGTNTTGPRIFKEQLTMSEDDARLATEIYFIARTIGCFLGGFLLRYVAPRIFFAISAVLMLIGMGLLSTGTSLIPLCCGVALVGFGNSNIFSVIFSQALVSTPNEKNEVSGLMIMGLIGGTIFPLAMGLASDAVNSQIGAIAVMTLGVVYLLFYTAKIKKA